MIYLFHRAEGFYPLDLESDEMAVENALANPGTLEVENAVTREIVWTELLSESELVEWKAKS